MSTETLVTCLVLWLLLVFVLVASIGPRSRIK